MSAAADVVSVAVFVSRLSSLFFFVWCEFLLLFYEFSENFRIRSHALTHDPNLYTIRLSTICQIVLCFIYLFLLFIKRDA